MPGAGRSDGVSVSPKTAICTEMRARLRYAKHGGVDLQPEAELALRPRVGLFNLC